MSIVAEQAVSAFNRNYKFTRVNYTGTAVTFLVDQSATAVAVVEPASGAPAVTLSAADANFEKTVTLAAGSSGTVVTVVTAHSGGTIASSKPSSRA